MSGFRYYGKKQWKSTKKKIIPPKLIQSSSEEDNPLIATYPGYNLYFSNNDAKDVMLNVDKIKICEDYFNQHLTELSLSNIEQNRFVILNFNDMFSNDGLVYKQWKNIRNDLNDNPEFVLNCIGLALYTRLSAHFMSERTNDEEDILETKILLKIWPRLINYEPMIRILDIGVMYFGKLISVKGTVIKVGTENLLCTHMTFMCNSCGFKQVLEQCGGAYTVPVKCPATGCRARSNFEPILSKTVVVYSQSIKIQEIIGNEQAESGGRVSRTLECEVSEDLVNSCIPGDDITVVGIVKRKSPENVSKSKQNIACDVILKAVSIVNMKNDSHGIYGASDRITFDVNDYYQIQRIHSHNKLFHYLVHSLCPKIYGHSIVKAGLVLALFGGTTSDSDHIRAQSHILIVGDPGLGKSQLLQACAKIAPRGVYVCGTTSSQVGLTVTLTKESGGESGLEAGALMLSDEGCCCIDEFDKMASQQACLLEAMEQQTISIAKAGSVVTLPARTTVLAAANPAGGHYNKAKTVTENLKMAPAILSRFDLIFILVDKPNENVDRLLSEHVLRFSTNLKENIVQQNVSNCTVTNLEYQLKLDVGEVLEEPLPAQHFRKYIAYAQKYVHPQLSNEAKLVLKEYYLKMRKQFQYGDCTPVTIRQLHSLIRLTQARAKVELREVATEQDALDVIEIMEQSLIEIFTDSNGLLDTSRSHNGTGMSKKNQIVRLLQLLKQKSVDESRSIFSTMEMKSLCEQANILKNNFHSVIDSLNLQGYLLCKGGNQYQLVCATI